jgi:putative DNA primase/helicase
MSEIDELADSVAGNGHDPVTLLLPPPNAPMEVARALVDERYTHPSGALTLRHWRGGWWEWQITRWVEVEARAARAAAYAFAEHAVYSAGDEMKPWAPNRHKIADLLDALAAIVHLPETVSMPSWLDGNSYDGLLVSCANGLLDVGRRELLKHDPRFFNATGVPFPYDPDAATPRRWWAFLNQLWGDDRASVHALAEWFGYTISGRLDQHKILLLVGPTRAGKGVTGRILGALVGEENVAARRCRASTVISAWRRCLARRSPSSLTLGSTARARTSLSSGSCRSAVRTH